MLRISLKAARINSNLPQKVAAQKLGVSNRTLGNWENGKSVVPADKIDAICALYKLNYDNLIFLPKRSL